MIIDRCFRRYSSTARDSGSRPVPRRSLVLRLLRNTAKEWELGLLRRASLPSFNSLSSSKMATWPYSPSSVFLLLYYFGALAACVPAEGVIIRTASAGVMRYFEQLRIPSLTLLPERLVGLCDFVLSPLQQRLIRIIHGQLEIRDMVQLLAACTLLQVMRLWKNRRRVAAQQDLKDCTASSYGGRRSHESVAESYNVVKEASASGESGLVQLGNFGSALEPCPTSN